MNRKKNTKGIFAYTTFGMQMALFMLIFVYGGHKLDIYLHSEPWFVIIGATIGLTGGLYNLIKGLKQIEKINEKGRTGKEDNKYKWF